MGMIIENTTKFPFVAEAYTQVEGQPPRLKWRCVIGNVDDRGRQMPVFSAEGFPIPGKTEPIPDSKPHPSGGAKGRLHSPVASFTTEEWKELEASPCFPVLQSLIKSGELTQRRTV